MSMKQYHQWALQSPINVHRTKKPSVAILIALLPRRTWSSTLWAHQRWCHQLPVLSSASHQRQKSSQQHALQENSPNHPISVGTAAPWKCYLIVPSVQRFWLVNFVTCNLSCLFILCEISYVFLCYPGLGLKAWPPNARHGNGRQITTKHPNRYQHNLKPPAFALRSSTRKSNSSMTAPKPAQETNWYLERSNQFIRNISTQGKMLRKKKKKMKK